VLGNIDSLLFKSQTDARNCNVEDLLALKAIERSYLCSLREWAAERTMSYFHPCRAPIPMSAGQARDRTPLLARLPGKFPPRKCLTM
jgi:hypothetical protein